MYLVRRWWGKEERDLPASRFRELFEELAAADDEHPEVSLKHESEWCLSCSRRGDLVYENVESGTPRHMKAVPVEMVLQLWSSLATGDLDAVERERWLPGYPT